MSAFLVTLTDAVGRPHRVVVEGIERFHEAVDAVGTHTSFDPDRYVAVQTVYVNDVVRLGNGDDYARGATEERATILANVMRCADSMWGRNAALGTRDKLERAIKYGWPEGTR